MRKMIIICDRCKKEIKGYPVQLVPQYTDRETGDILDEGYPEEESQSLKTYCNECIAKILACANGLALNPDFEKAVQKMEDPQEDDIKKPAGKSTHSTKKKLDINTVLDLKKSGKTNQEIADMFGSTKGSVAVLISKHKKAVRVLDEEFHPSVDTLKEIDSGVSVLAIAKRYSLSREQIQNILNHYIDSVLDGKTKDEEAKMYLQKKQLKTVDYGKLQSLMNAGWQVAQIAEELKISSSVAAIAICKVRKENG